MEGTQLRAPALLARVVRNFLGSRLERELLSRAFALARREPLELGDATDSEAVAERGPAASLASLRKGA